MVKPAMLSFNDQTFKDLHRVAKRNFFWTLQPMFVFACTVFPEYHPTEYRHAIDERRHEKFTRMGQRPPGQAHHSVIFNRKGPFLEEARRAAHDAMLSLSEYLALITLRYAEQFPQEFESRAMRFQKKEKDRRKWERADIRESRLVAPSEPIGFTADGRPIFSHARSRRADSGEGGHPLQGD